MPIPPKGSAAAGDAPRLEVPWRGHLPVLDGLRGVAILLVMLLHFQLDRPDTELGRVYATLVDSGWAGVDLFFVLSGFLITGILYDHRGEPDYFRNFFVRRVLRIFPLYYGFLVVRFLVAPYVLSPDWVDLHATAAEQAWSWLYAVNLQFSLPGAPWPPPFVGHFWSLAIEEQFYLVWPAVVLLLTRARLLALCVAMVASALVLRTVFIIGFDNYSLPYFFTPARMDALALGSMVALVARGSSAAALGTMRRLAPPVAVSTGVVILLLFMWRTLERKDPIIGTIGFSLVAVFFTALLIVAMDARPGSLLQRALASGFLRFFGRYSYALYVFHLVIHRILKRTLFLPERTPALIAGIPAQLVFLVTATLLSVIVAVASWHLFEKHFLKLKSRFEYGRSAQARMPVGLGGGSVEGDGR